MNFGDFLWEMSSWLCLKEQTPELGWCLAIHMRFGFVKVMLVGRVEKGKIKLLVRRKC